MPSDSIHIAPVITTDTLSPILSDSNRIISDSLRTTHPEWDLHYKKDSVKFTPQYAESLSAYCYAPIDNPLTDYKEAALVIPEGFEGIPKIENPSQNDGIFLILLCCFILVATSFRRGIKLFSQPFSASKTNRNRTDMADNSTIIESRLRFILLAQTFVMEGIALTFLIHYLKPELTYIGYFKEILCAAVLATIGISHFRFYFHRIGHHKTMDRQSRIYQLIIRNNLIPYYFLHDLSLWFSEYRTFISYNILHFIPNYFYL